MSILKWQVNSSRNFVSLFSFMEDNFLYLFSSNNIYFTQKKPIKVKIFWDFPVFRSKFVKFLMPIWNDKSIPLQILHPYSISWKITPLCFFSSNNLYFAQKEQGLKLESNFVKFLVSTLKWQVNSSSKFALFFIVMTDNSSVDFKLILFQLWIKGPHQNPNFEIFKCSGENFLYSSCHFSNHKPVESNVR